MCSCGGNSWEDVWLKMIWLSVTCDTPQDAAARISATGAQGGLLGRRDIEEPAFWARCARNLSPPPPT